MSIRKRGPRAYQVRVAGFPAQTAPTRESAEKIELDLKRRRALGDLYEGPPITLGEAIDGTLARINATRGVSEKTRSYNALSAKVWTTLRETRLPMLRRATIEDLILERAKSHPRSAKNELEFLKRVLHDAKGRGQRVDEAIFAIPAVKHRPRKGRGLTVSELHELASWFPEHSSRLILLAGQVGCRRRRSSRRSSWPSWTRKGQWTATRPVKVSVKPFQRMGGTGLEPVTPSLSSWCSPN